MEELFSIPPIQPLKDLTPEERERLWIDNILGPLSTIGPDNHHDGDTWDEVEANEKKKEDNVDVQPK